MDDLHLPSQIPVDEDYGQRRDTDLDDGGSAFSIASSKWNFTWENGRLYHDYKAGHPFPYDSTSQENEETMHVMMLYILEDKFIAAPVKEQNLRNVLDIGTGLGYWAEGVADRYPDCHVIGIDTAPHEPSLIPNCEFTLADATEEWLFGKAGLKFDLIHIRSLFASLTEADWPALYKQSFDRMESGGWIEQTEVEITARCDDDTGVPNSQIEHLANLSFEMGTIAGRYFRICDTAAGFMREAGFQDVKVAKTKLPLGPWSADARYKDIGRLYERYYKTGAQGWLMHILTKTMGYTPDQVNAEVVKAFAEIDSRRHHYYFNMNIVAGRKP